MRPRSGFWLLAGAIAAVLLALLGWGAIAVAERYFSDNNDLRDLAVALVPPGAKVILEDSSECSRSGWDGVFTFRDTCHEIRFSLPESASEAGFDATVALAESNGWTILAEHNGRSFDVRLPGYRGYVRLREAADIQACVASAPQEPGFCYHSVSVIEAD
jgi:hypothetical protein